MKDKEIINLGDFKVYVDNPTHGDTAILTDAIVIKMRGEDISHRVTKFTITSDANDGYIKLKIDFIPFYKRIINKLKKKRSKK